MVDKNKAREAIELLVEKYQRVLSSDNIKSYTEETAKKDFILPLFEALGWDVYNKYTEDEVTAEEKVSKGRVDYAFRINGIPKLFVEAKSLKADLKKFSDRRYEQAQKTMIIIAGMIKRLECYLDEGQYLAGKSTTIVMPTKIEPKLLLAY